MPVGYILAQAGNKIGLDPSSERERATLLRLLNEAAPELYQQGDLPGSLMENTFKVNGDQTITCPWEVGSLRGVRESASTLCWHINGLRPRYYQFNWPDMWRNIRLKYLKPLVASVDNQAPVTVSVFAVETPPVVVTLSGPTLNSSLVHEEIVMDATAKVATTPFLDFTAVKKDRPSTYDVTVKQVDGKELTFIPNHEKEAKFQVIDVSQVPWLPTSAKINNYLELLYKRRLQYLSDDADEFPAFDCDNALVNKMMQLWKEEQDNAEGAALYDSKSTRTVGRLTEDQKRGQEETVALVENPHDTLLERTGQGWWRLPGRRYY